MTNWDLWGRRGASGPIGTHGDPWVPMGTYGDLSGLWGSMDAYEGVWRQGRGKAQDSFLRHPAAAVYNQSLPCH